MDFQDEKVSNDVLIQSAAGALAEIAFQAKLASELIATSDPTYYESIAGEALEWVATAILMSAKNIAETMLEQEKEAGS